MRVPEYGGEAFRRGFTGRERGKKERGNATGCRENKISLLNQGWIDFRNFLFAENKRSFLCFFSFFFLIEY